MPLFFIVLILLSGNLFSTLLNFGIYTVKFLGLANYKLSCCNVVFPAQFIQPTHLQIRC